MAGSLDLSEFQDTLVPIGQPPVRDPWAIPGGATTPASASSTMPGSPVSRAPSGRMSPVILLAVGLVGVAVVFVGVRGLLDGLTITRDEAVAAFVHDCVDAAEQRDVAGITAALAEDWSWEGADPTGDQRQDLALAALLDEVRSADEVSLALRSLQHTVTASNAHVSAGVTLILKGSSGTVRHQADLDGWLRSTPDGWRVGSIGIVDIR